MHMTYARTLTRPLATLLALLLLLLSASEASAQDQAPWKARGRKYRVTINSSPANGTIYLNDKRYGIVGYTPFKGRITRGDYKLIIELPGHATYEKQIRVARRTSTFFAMMIKKANPGLVDVQATADNNVLGADVEVDGMNKGTAPILLDLNEGRHQLKISKSGFLPFEQWLSVVQGQRITVNPVLKAAKGKGSILVDADVPDAEVYVDGKKHPDLTPTLVEDVEEGTHVISVKKAPAVPWKQSVTVKANERVKITAELSASMQSNKVGNIKVWSNVEGARVFLDGTEKGKTPVTLQAVPAGVHTIQVSAEGYEPQEVSVTVNSGSAANVKVTIGKKNRLTKASMIKVVSPVPEALVFIDGANVGAVPVDKELAPGPHFIRVEKKGYRAFEQKITVETGQKMTVTAELRAVGTVRFLSSMRGAEVLIDSEPVGNTPLLKDDVDVGQHIITIRMKDHYDFEGEVDVKGGEIAIVNADLKRINTGPTPEETARLLRGLSSFGARTMPLGRFTLDAGAGYPYWLEARATVGVSNKPSFGWDFGVGMRSFLTTWEILATVRARFFDREPFSAGAFGTIGGGAGFKGRNMFTFQTGFLASTTFRNLVTVTGRAYLDVWSDRLCGEPDPLVPTATTSPGGPDVCVGDAMNTTQDDYNRAGQLTGIDFLTMDCTTDPKVCAKQLQARDGGVRLMMSLVIEAAFHQRFNLYFIFEGAPFQSERAAHTDVFNESLLGADPGYNLRGGLTAKF